MSSETIIIIVQMVAAFGVVISVIYLGIQIHQSTGLLKSSPKNDDHQKRKQQYLNSVPFLGGQFFISQFFLLLWRLMFQFTHAHQIFLTKKIKNFISTDLEWIPLNSIQASKEQQKNLIEFFSYVEIILFQIQVQKIL